MKIELPSIRFLIVEITTETETDLHKKRAINFDFFEKKIFFCGKLMTLNIKKLPINTEEWGRGGGGNKKFNFS